MQRSRRASSGQCGSRLHAEERGAGGVAHSVDANDPQQLAEFWSAATGWAIANRGDYGVSLHRPGDRPPDIDLVRVPEPKTVKGRVHLDVHPPADGTPAAEVERLRALGATPADVGQGPDVSWVVLQDPEGNEFCVLTPQD